MDVITFAEAKLEEGWLKIRIPCEFLGTAMSWIRKKQDKKYDLSIKEHRQKRSLDANAYAWVLINKIADALRITPKEIYRQAIQDIAGNHEIVPIKTEAADKFKQVWESQGLGWPCVDMGSSKIAGYRNMKAYYGSSTYNTRQMSLLIDHLVQDCKALDIETLPPDKLALLLEAQDA